jgi:hypothetical protein
VSAVSAKQKKYNGPLPIPCPYCKNKSFDTPELIKSHLIRAHPGKGGIAKLKEMGFDI